MRPCHWCAKQTTSPRRVCNDCIGIDLHAGRTSSEKDALQGGRWVIDTRRRVQVWEPFFGPFEDAS